MPSNETINNKTDGMDSFMSENSETKVCQICGDTLDNGTIVYCAFCGTPHHSDCWDYNKQCSTYNCGSSRYLNKPLIKNFSIGDTGSLCQTSVENGSSVNTSGSFEQVLKIDESGDGWLAGKRVSMSRAPSWKNPGRYSEMYDAPAKEIVEFDFSTDYSRIDSETELEKFYVYSSITFLVVSIGAVIIEGRPPSWALAQFCSVGASLLMLLRMFTDCTYVLDNENKLLLYSRSIFGFTKNWKLCQFDEVQCVGVNALYIKEKHSHYYNYSVVLKLPNDCSITVSSEKNDYRETERLAETLANHLETEFISSEPGTSSFTPRYIEFPMTPVEIQWRTWPVFGRPDFQNIVLFILSLLVAVFMFSRGDLNWCYRLFY